MADGLDAIRQARSAYAAKPTRTHDPLPREACSAKLANGLTCGRDVAVGKELCQSHGALERESRRIDGWLEKALNLVCERDASEHQVRVRAAIVEAVGMLSRNPRRRVKPLSAAGEVLMSAVTGQKLPAKADPMAKEWGNSGA